MRAGADLAGQGTDQDALAAQLRLQIGGREAGAARVEIDQVGIRIGHLDARDLLQAARQGGYQDGYRDGLAAVIGWVAAILSILVLAVLSKAILAAILAFFATLVGMF